MRISVLTENTSLDERFECEHGLSLFIEADGRNILFDTGQSDMFSRNAEKMCIPLEKVDIAVLSHGHYDHGGGIKKFFEINEKAKLYLSENAFSPCFNGTKKYIGLDPTIKESDRLVFCGDHKKISENLLLCTCNGRETKEKINPYGLNILRNNSFIPDGFLHEQYLVIYENRKKIVISGCSHKGIINIADWLKPDILIGGFHFKKLDPATENGKYTLTHAACELMKSKTEYYTCHCTGEEQYDFLKKIMGDRLHYIRAGESFIV